ncbi:glucose-6-phosphate isomerase [Kallipyga massiliensis]|uniref:glucose-6-phosphate isomerase n=1 Tax=Kallipyga massiliensis TaxID=1472764 RepID=UPI0005565DF2|nr:glucose-6-phosphate isomerase [Kallipyga massiliensis]
MLKITVENAIQYKDKFDSLLDEANHHLADLFQSTDSYTDSKGWVNLNEHASQEKLDRIISKAQEIREQADAFVLIGVGGSNNAARSVIESIGDKSGTQIIYAGDTLHPQKIQETINKLEDKSFYIDCIAKNFETLEPGSGFRVLRKLCERTYGDEYARRVITTGTVDSLLHKISRQEGFDFFDFPLNVGGRFTAMTNVGLLPMAVANVDIKALVKGAEEMKRSLIESPPSENPALIYSIHRNIFYGLNRKLEILSSFDYRFNFFFKWWRQLFAESEGKDGKGIFPVTGEFSEELHSIGQFLQDGEPIIFETFLEVINKNESYKVPKDHIHDQFDYLDGKDFSEINRMAYEATVEAHKLSMPVMNIQIDSLDAYHFGQLFYFFQVACYVSCKLMGVNPFNQPGVESYKKEMFRKLGKL